MDYANWAQAAAGLTLSTTEFLRLEESSGIALQVLASLSLAPTALEAAVGAAQAVRAAGSNVPTAVFDGLVVWFRTEFAARGGEVYAELEAYVGEPGLVRLVYRAADAIDGRERRQA